MKKGVKVFTILAVMFLLVGCGTNNDKEVVKKCTLVSDQSASGYSLNSVYEIHAKGNIVNSVITEETVTSDNESILTYFESQLNTSYKTASDTYGGYDYSVEKTDNQVTSKVTIDYTKMNMDKFVEDNSSMKAYVNSKNEITLDGVTNIYESLGATCE